MIKLEIEPYCEECMNFSPDVVKPEKSILYGFNHNTGEREEVVSVSDTIIRCEGRRNCSNILRYLEKQMKGESNGR